MNSEEKLKGNMWTGEEYVSSQEKSSGFPASERRF